LKKERINVLLEEEGSEPKLVGTILGFDIQPEPVGIAEGNIAVGGPRMRFDWFDNYGQPRVVSIRVKSSKDVELLKV
jgi:hypothetical protein